MGKTRDLFQKIIDTKETFHVKMGTIKDWNGMDPTEAEDIKKKWQEYTEELYKKDLHYPDNHNGVITYLEPDILECKVKWEPETNWCWVGVLGCLSPHLACLCSLSALSHV